MTTIEVPLNASNSITATVISDKSAVAIPDSSWVPKCHWLRGKDASTDSRSAPEYRASVACAVTAAALGPPSSDCGLGACWVPVEDGLLCMRDGDGWRGIKEYRLMASRDTFRGNMLVPRREMTNSELLSKVWRPKPGEKTADRVVLLNEVLSGYLLAMKQEDFYAQLVAVTGMLKSIPRSDIYRVLGVCRIALAVASKHIDAIGKLIAAIPKPLPFPRLPKPVGGELKGGCQAAVDSVGKAISRGTRRVQHALFGKSPRERESEEPGMSTSCMMAVLDVTKAAGESAARRGLKTGGRGEGSDSSSSEEEEESGALHTTSIGGLLRYTSAEHFLASLGVDPVEENFEKLDRVTETVSRLLFGFLDAHAGVAEKAGKMEFLNAMAKRRKVTADYPIVYSPAVRRDMREIFGESKRPELVEKFDRLYGSVMIRGAMTPSVEDL